MDIQKIMKQAQALQAKMADMQQKLAEEIVEGNSGGGLVKVKSNCKGDIKAVDIDVSLLKPEEKEILEDLIIAAIKNAKESADNVMNTKMKEVGGSMGLPEDALKFPF